MIADFTHFIPILRKSVLILRKTLTMLFIVVKWCCLLQERKQEGKKKKMTLKQLQNKNKNAVHCFWFRYSYNNVQQLDMPVFAYCEAHAIALFIEAFEKSEIKYIEVSKITLEKTL